MKTVAIEGTDKMINHDYLINLTKELYAAQLEEFDLSTIWIQAKVKTDEAKALSLSVAYHAGPSFGKNADERQRNEIVFLSSDNAYQTALQAENEAYNNYQMAKIWSKRIENEISLTKAWLYSQRGSNE